MVLSANIGSLLAVKYGYIQSYPIDSATVIWKGGVVAVRLTTGKIHPVEEDADDSLRQLVVGFAREASAAGDTDNVRVRMEGKLRMNFIGGTPVVGQLAIVKDDNTAKPYDDTEGVANIIIGRITEIDGSYIYVDIQDRPNRLASSLYD